VKTFPLFFPVLGAHTQDKKQPSPNRFGTAGSEERNYRLGRLLGGSYYGNNLSFNSRNRGNRMLLQVVHIVKGAAFHQPFMYLLHECYHVR